MNTHPAYGYRRIYPDDSPRSRDQRDNTARADRDTSNTRQSAGSLPIIRPANPYESSSESGKADDSPHIHVHHYHAYFLPPSPPPHQPQVATTVGRTYDEDGTRYGCTPTCLVVLALLTGGVIALLIVAMGLTLVGQMLTVPPATPTASPTPAHITPTPPKR